MLLELRGRLLVLLGHFFFGLGAIGIFLPIMPSAPFFLIACWCYARGSPKIHAAMLKNRFIGQAIANWEKNRSISHKAKFVAISSLSLSIIYTLVFISVIVLKIVAVLIIVAVMIFIITRPLPNQAA